MDQIMGAINKTKQSLRDEIAAQCAQFKKEIEELRSKMLSNASQASNSRNPRQSDIGNIAKQLVMEDPIHEDDEDAMSEHGVPTISHYPSLNRQIVYERLSRFEEDASKLPNHLVQNESSPKAASEQPQQAPRIKSKLLV
ncbi:hypothetical protein BVRB_8g186850 [Beta vulgaris subsp. vulgaris]|nr:hypothetical protein BVRB_8g186850 [Beta vulgaris subsp. vulgaris]